MMGQVSLRSLWACLAAALLLFVLVSADDVDVLQAKGMAQFNAALAKSKTCTKDKLRVRREWSKHTTAEKKAYIAAVKCLIKSPPRVNATEFPGSKSRFDDFISIHMKYTLLIHGTGNFLHWHRHFTYAYEEALRNECHYNGTQPYFNWGSWPQPEKSPLLDGSETSISGDGEYINHTAGGLRPVGNGGGCIKNGPFKGMQINLGPMNVDDPKPAPNPRADGFGYNPRCVKRDLSGFLVSTDATPAKTALLITNSTDIKTFQDRFQAVGNVHVAGHFVVAGDPGSDFYTSPGDPFFYFHHSMCDRVWWIWQLQDYNNRQQVIGGNRSPTAGPPATELTDIIDLEALNWAGIFQLKDIVSTVDGPYCYTYE